MQNIVEQRDWRSVARTKTFHRQQCERTIFGGFVRLNAQSLANTIEDRLMSADFASESVADSDDAFPHRFERVFLIKRNSVEHIGWCDLEKVGDLNHRLIWHMSVCVLHIMQNRHESTVCGCILWQRGALPTRDHLRRAVRLTSSWYLHGAGWFCLPGHSYSPI